jgi:RNA polymerase primary sigma factor
VEPEKEDIMKTMKKKKAHTMDKSLGNEKNSLNLYLSEIKRFPLLSKAEEEKYAVLASQGNKYAREQLLNSNLRFVISVAKKYQGKGLPLEDLISEGNLGLMNAVEHFDVEKGFRFITYAVWWIRQAITRAIQEKGRMIRLPSNKANEISLIDRTRQVIQNAPGMNADGEIREIAAFLEMAPKKAADLVQISYDAISLDDPSLKNRDLLTVKDFVMDENAKAPEEYAITSTLSDELEEIINSCLEKRSAEIIRCRFGLGGKVPLTLKEIGNRLNLSRERIRQIETHALKRLRKSPHNKKLSSYTA